MTDAQAIKNLKKDLAFYQSVVTRQNTEIARLMEDCDSLTATIETLRAEIKYLKRITADRCGTCMYAKPVQRPGKTTVWVECTNEEHLRKYCTNYEGTKYRPKYTHACRNYKERPSDSE